MIGSKEIQEMITKGTMRERTITSMMIDGKGRAEADQMIEGRRVEVTPKEDQEKEHQVPNKIFQRIINKKKENFKKINDEVK